MQPDVKAMQYVVYDVRQEELGDSIFHQQRRRLGSPPEPFKAAAAAAAAAVGNRLNENNNNTGCSATVPVHSFKATNTKE